MEFSLKAKPLLIISYHPVQYGIIPNKFAVEGKLFSRRLAEMGLMVFELVIGNRGVIHSLCLNDSCCCCQQYWRASGTRN